MFTGSSTNSRIMIEYLRRFIALPLLAKDLTERAARPRTYVFRVVFGLLFLGAFWLVYHRMHRGDGSGALEFRVTELMGFGRALFDAIALMLIGSILLFQPALMAGGITHEKERETLPLLMLADVRPWRFLVQKLIAGMIPMFTLLLYGLPLSAIAYAYGGLDGTTLLSAAAAILGAWLQVSTLSLLCSAFFRATTTATVVAYVLTALITFGIDPLIHRDGHSRSSWQPDTFVEQVMRSLHISPLAAFERAMTINDGDEEVFSVRLTVMNRTASGTDVLRVLALCPIYLSALIFAVMARMILLRRAFAPPSHFGRRIFARLDEVFQKMNSRVGGFALFENRDHSLPLNEPVLWRETSRGILGRSGHLMRLVLMLGTLLTGICTLILISADWTAVPRSLNLLHHALVILGIVCVAASAVQAIGGERMRQTLQILLTTPVSASEIVRQKIAASRRLGWVFGSNILIVGLLKLVAEYFDGDFRDEDGWLPVSGNDAAILGAAYPFFHAVCLVTGIAVLFAIVRWVAMLFGIGICSRNRAFFACLGLLALWTSAPAIMGFVAPDSVFLRHWVVASSPMGLLYVNNHATFEHLYQTGTFNHLFVGSSALEAHTTDPITAALSVLVIHLAMIRLFQQLAVHLAARRLYEH